MKLIEPVTGNLETAGGLIAVLREDEEIVSIADQLQTRFLQGQIEIGEEEVCQQRRDRTALRDSDADGLCVMTIPAKAVDPSVEKIAERVLRHAGSQPFS